VEEARSGTVARMVIEVAAESEHDDHDHPHASAG
jgi:hypothetical protein